MVDSEELKELLQTVLDDEDELSKFALEYHVGHTEMHDRIKLVVTQPMVVCTTIPKGTPVEMGEEESTAQVKNIPLTAKILRKFIERILENEIWKIENCSETADPDTARIEISVKKKGESKFHAEVWESCKKGDERLSALIDALEELCPEESLEI